jgi:hypothetical protein
MIGKTYYGLNWDREGPWHPVTVLARADWKRGGPRNVLIQREDGSRAVRPFRGLRIKKPGETA